jgi:hypothetical protein
VLFSHGRNKAVLLANDLINVTKISTSDSRDEIAQISNDGNVNKISADDNIVVTYTMSVIAITLNNVSCSDNNFANIIKIPS